MNRLHTSAVALLLLFVSLALAPVARGQVALVDLKARGSGQDYWVCVVREDPHVPNSVISSIRQRTDPVAGRWTEVALLRARVIDIAGLGDRVAVLQEDGEWQTMSRDGAHLGAPLPDHYRLTRLAADGEILWALATQRTPTTAPAVSPATKPATTGPALPDTLFRQDGTAWTRVGALPSGVTSDAHMVVRAGQVYITYSAAGTIVVDRFEQNAWKNVCKISGVTDGRLIDNMPRPSLAARTGGQEWAIYDLSAPQPREVLKVKASLPGDVTAVGSTLRIVYEGKDEYIEQISVDHFGNGPVQKDPVRIAVVGPPEAAAQEWLNLVLLGLLTVAMLVTIRQKPAIPVEALEAVQLRLAPMGRRIAAGLIDAVPLLVAVAYLYVHFAEAVAKGFLQWDEAQVAVFAGLAIYLLHVTVCEMIFARTLGKWLLGLRVVNIDGSRPTVGRLFLRNLMRLLDFFICYVFIILSPMRQRIGDVTAMTVVVMDQRPAVEAPK